jgi:hypothetical protein
MGVYVFKSKHADYVKVGHYVGEDAWGRVARRGFYSCISPRVLREKRDACDLDLLAWFPRLSTKHERKIHGSFRDADSVGEWHAARQASAIIAELTNIDASVLKEEEINGTSHENRRRRKNTKTKRPVVASASRGARGYVGLDYVSPDALPEYAFVEE